MLGSKEDRDLYNRLFNSVGEGEGGMIGVNSIETYTLPVRPIEVGYLGAGRWLGQ